LRYLQQEAVIPLVAKAGKNLGFLDKVFSFFLVLMYEDRTQNYDPENREEYLIHHTPIPLPHHL